jgi:hypothetical protein
MPIIEVLPNHSRDQPGVVRPREPSLLRDKMCADVWLAARVPPQ